MRKYVSRTLRSGVPGTSRPFGTPINILASFDDVNDRVLRHHGAQTSTFLRSGKFDSHSHSAVRSSIFD